MAVENLEIVEKAMRLVDTCRERSLKHNDNIPAVFRYYVEGYKEEVMKLGSVLEWEASHLGRLRFIGSIGSLPFGAECTNDSGRIVHRLVSFIYDENILHSILRCLREYSELRQGETPYDEMLDCSLGQFHGWERGMCLLVDFYSENHKGDTKDFWILEWSDIFDAIGKATLPLTQEPPKDLRPAAWFETHTDIQGSGLKQITSEMLRNAVRDGNLNNWKPDDKPNANNQYSIQEVKDFYKEYAHILPNE